MKVEHKDMRRMRRAGATLVANRAGSGGRIIQHGYREVPGYEVSMVLMSAQAA